MKHTVFISDLHLSEETPDLNQVFFDCLAQRWHNADALYILGDFFDYWAGDDDTSDFIELVKRQLKDFSRRVPVFFLHGNRDFLLQQKFADEAGLTLLNDAQVVMLYGKKWLICHGDELCTDDLAYQQFRAQSRQKAWQNMVLSKSLAERKMLAMEVRRISQTRKDGEGLSAISDATEQGVRQLLAALNPDKGPCSIIHGHTHRPHLHTHVVDNEAINRYVLSDWDKGQGGALIVYDNLQVALEFYP